MINDLRENNQECLFKIWIYSTSNITVVLEEKLMSIIIPYLISLWRIVIKSKRYFLFFTWARRAWFIFYFSIANVKQSIMEMPLFSILFCWSTITSSHRIIIYLLSIIIIIPKSNNNIISTTFTVIRLQNYMRVLSVIALLSLIVTSVIALPCGPATDLGSRNSPRRKHATYCT